MIRPEDIATFRALHNQGFLLPNVWDAASARIFEAAGFPAIGTTSAGIAYAWGRPDGQSLSRREMLEAVKRIADAVAIPVNADIEAGYGDLPAEVAQTVREFAELGVVGLNLEDATGRAEQPLYLLAEQERRLAAARAATPAFLNARIDTYITGFGRDETERLAETIRRGQAYLQAGADGLFVPLVTDLLTIRTLAAELAGPLNVMAYPGAPAVPDLRQAGAARVSLGQSVMLASLGLTAQIAHELGQTGTYQAMQPSFYGFAEAQALFAETS